MLAQDVHQPTQVEIITPIPLVSNVTLELQPVLPITMDQILTLPLGEFQPILSLAAANFLVFTACQDIRSKQVSALLHLVPEQDKLLVLLMAKQLHLGKILDFCQN